MKPIDSGVGRWLAAMGTVARDRSKAQWALTMMYSTTCSYAIRAMCRLSVIRPDGYARVQEVCAGADLPEQFLAKVFRDLVKAGLLNSAKGRGGGFSLARRPHEIRLYDIVQAIDGIEPYTRCVVGLAKCDSNQPCPQHEAYKPVRKQILAYLESTTLDQMSDALARKLQLIGQAQSCTVDAQTPGTDQLNV